MSKHLASISWQRNDDNFLENRYSRAHSWRFDGGQEVMASASPHIVPTPWSEPANVDPEEAFVASLASCHMLFFLSIARESGYQVDSYIDEAEGTLGKDSSGNLAITAVQLRPRVEFSGDNIPDKQAIDAIHHQAHEHCFIANSVKTAISIHSL